MEENNNEKYVRLQRESRGWYTGAKHFFAANEFSFFASVNTLLVAIAGFTLNYLREDILNITGLFTIKILLTLLVLLLIEGFSFSYFLFRTGQSLTDKQKETDTKANSFLIDQNNKDKLEDIRNAENEYNSKYDRIVMWEKIFEILYGFTFLIIVIIVLYIIWMI